MPHSHTDTPAGSLPLRFGQAGEAIRDLQMRLVRAASTLITDDPGRFGDTTLASVIAFQQRVGLQPDGICGTQTWSALVESGYALGDRLLYQRTPMLRGDDVSDLQHRLSALGFLSSRVDGIFGPETSAAVTSFQRNAGLTTDGVVGPSVLDQLHRLGGRTGTVTKAHLHEQITLQDAPRLLSDQRIVIAESGTLPAIAGAIGRALDDAGARTLIVHHPDGSAQAAEANRFDAMLFLGLTGRAEPGARLAYYETAGFESMGGHRFADFAADALRSIDLPGEVVRKGMRLATLRETRMPALCCEVGPVHWLVEHAASVAGALAWAAAQWTAEPLEPTE